MKKKSAILRFCLGLVVLSAILFQSFDSFGHLARQFSEKHCDHKYALNKNDISHSHHNSEKCFVCEFTFSHFIAADIFVFRHSEAIHHSGYSFSHSKEITQFFRGSLFSHRGPPVFIA